MTELFLKVFNMSVSASWLVLAVLVLRLALKKAPKWVNVLLWGVVALRLVCPFSIESALSLIPSAQTVPQEIVFAAQPAIQSGVAAVDAAVNPVLSESFAPSTTVTSVNPIQIFLAVWANIWLLGALAPVLWALVSYWRLRRKVSTAVRLEGNVYQSEAVASPFILGLFRPRIYLPFSMGEGQRAHVLAHERAHLARRDHWWKPLGYALLCIHWFNPLLWLAYVLLCRDIELACDEKVVRDLGKNERADYSEALLACAVGRRSIAACPLAFGEVGVKERVRSVLHYKKPAFWLVALSLVVCAVVAVCFLTDPKEKSGSEGLNCELVLPDTGSVLVPPRYYPEGFDFDYDALDASEIVGTERLVFEADRETDALTVGVDYYETLADGAVHIDRRTLTLERREDGTFTMMAEHKNPGREESAVYFIEGTGGGKYVMKVRFPAEPTARDVVVSADADFDHDGVSETVYVRTLAEGEYYELSIVKADGTLLYRTEAYTPHMGWTTLLLYEDDGKDYLISYFPAMWQGVGTYEWTQFYLEKGENDEVGTPIAVDSARVEFELPLTMTDELAGFAERTNWLLQNSTVLLTTEQGEVVIGPAAAVNVPQVYPVMYDPDDVSVEMTGISEPFADGQPMEFLFASGAGAWGTTLTLYPDGSFEGIYEDSDMGSTGPGHPGGTRYICRFTGRFGERKALEDAMWSMQLLELTHEAAGREWIEERQLHISSEAYGIEGGREFILCAPEASLDALNEEFLWWSPETALHRQGTLTRLGRWGLWNVETDYGFFEYTPYAPSEELAETLAEHEGKTYFSNLLGYDGYMEVTERIGEVWELRTYYAVEDGEGRPIAESFGFGEAEDYAVDLDGDGEMELVCNVTFGADGAQRVYVYQRRGDEIWLGRLPPNGKEDFDNWGVNAYRTEYDANEGVFLLHYVRKQDGEETVETIAGLDAFTFGLYEPSAN